MVKYSTVAEAYGFWKNSSVAVMEARAKAIEKDIAEVDSGAVKVNVSHREIINLFCSPSTPCRG